MNNARHASQRTGGSVEQPTAAFAALSTAGRLGRGVGGRAIAVHDVEAFPDMAPARPVTVTAGSAPVSDVRTPQIPAGDVDPAASGQKRPFDANSGAVGHLKAGLADVLATQLDLVDKMDAMASSVAENGRIASALEMAIARADAAEAESRRLRRELDAARTELSARMRPGRLARLFGRR